MSSATDIPEHDPIREDNEPLLGEPGDVTQKRHEALQWNLVTGTATLAQAGIWILTAIVWSAVFESKFIFFSYHPILNSAGILLLVQAILVLQPTSTQKHKVQGTYVHSILNTLSIGLLIAGLVVIEMNKASHPETRFQSTHGKVGLVVYILLGLQFIIGVIQFYFPTLVLGSVNKGKALYKYHRASGYVILVLSLTTICLAVYTGFNTNALHMRLWSLLVASILVVLGVGARIKKSKFGF